MSNDPDQIRSEIEATRSGLSANVNALSESVRPGNVARRQVDKVSGGISTIKDKVMGSSDDGPGTLDRMSGATSSAVGTVKETAAAAPGAATRGTRGNPLAAGLIAFGAGWLMGSLLPATNTEQQAAEALKEKAAPLQEGLTDAAKSVAADLKEPAQQAAEQVKASAADAAATVKDEAKGTADDLKTSSQDADDHVRQNG